MLRRLCSNLIQKEILSKGGVVQATDTSGRRMNTELKLMIKTTFGLVVTVVVKPRMTCC